MNSNDAMQMCIIITSVVSKQFNAIEITLGTTKALGNQVFLKSFLGDGDLRRCSRTEVNRRLNFEEQVDGKDLQKFARPKGVMPGGSMLPLPPQADLPAETPAEKEESGAKGTSQGKAGKKVATSSRKASG